MVLPLPVPLCVPITTIPHRLHAAFPASFAAAWNDPRVLAFSARLVSPHREEGTWVDQPNIHTHTNGATTPFTATDGMRRLDNPGTTQAVEDLIVALDHKRIDPGDTECVWRTATNTSSEDPIDVEVFFTRYGMAVRNACKPYELERLTRPFSRLYHDMITDPKALSKAARAIRFYPHHTQIGGLLIVPAHASAHGALASITTTKAFATLWHHLLFAGHKRPFPFVLETYPWKP